MSVMKDQPEPSGPPRLGEYKGLYNARMQKWAKYDGMMLSVIAACERHLDIIRTEQTRADEELIVIARKKEGK